MKIALVGIGKIARDQHIPSIAESSDWELAATVSRDPAGTVPGVEAFSDLATMLTKRPDIPVVSLCLPPQPRFAFADMALRAGRHVMLEKPPGQTLAEVHALHALAKAKAVSLYATWHSRMAHCVEATRAWLTTRRITRLVITWKEDVRRWHPGQEWVFEPGGLGVFDPGINALSILTHILPAPVHLTAATLSFPKGRAAPIAASLSFTGNVHAEFDWRQEGPQTWDIAVETDGGSLLLQDGGATLVIDGKKVESGPNREYPALYAQMAKLVKTSATDVDLAPMIHVADAFTLGRRREVEAFSF